MGTNLFFNNLLSYGSFDLGINDKYATDKTGLSNLCKWLNRKSIAVDYLFNNQSEYLISIRAYPFLASKFFRGVDAKAKFPIGPFGKNEVNVTGQRLWSQKGVVKLAEYTIARKYNNFMDYSPFTKISAYIPFINYVSLPVNEIMGKTIKFYCNVDFDNGTLTVWLVCNEIVLQTWETPVGVDIALNRTNANELMRNGYLWAIETVTGLGGSMTSLNPISKGWSTAGKVGTGWVGANQHHIDHGHIATGTNKFYSPTSLYLVFEREIPIHETSDYAHTIGKPLQKTCELQTLTGYTIVDQIHFDPMNTLITDTEINEIVSLLRAGVHL